MKKGTRVEFTFAGMKEKGTVQTPFKKGTEEWLIVKGDDGNSYPFNKKDLSCLKVIK